MDAAPGRHDRQALADPPVHGLAIPVLGIPVHFEGNDPAVVTAAAEAFAAWRGVEHVPRLVSANESARVRVWIEESPETADDDARDGVVPRYQRPDRDRLIVRAGWSVGIADAARADAVLFIDSDLMADKHAFRADFLEPLVLATLTRFDRVPLRAAAVEHADVALLLAGPPGSGKSTLACAAALAGFRVLADDLVHVQLEPRLRVWGLPGFIQLPASAARFFPDIAIAAPRTGFGERERIILNVRELSALPALPVAQRAGVCVLAPSSGEPRIVALEPGTLEDLLLRSQTRDAPSEEFAEPVHMLSRHGGWQLETGDDPATAIELLRETLDELLVG